MVCGGTFNVLRLIRGEGGITRKRQNKEKKKKLSKRDSQNVGRGGTAGGNRDVTDNKYVKKFLNIQIFEFT